MKAAANFYNSLQTIRIVTAGQETVSRRVTVDEDWITTTQQVTSAG